MFTGAIKVIWSLGESSSYRKFDTLTPCRLPRDGIPEYGCPNHAYWQRRAAGVMPHARYPLPYLTLCWNRERPVTLREHNGASVLVGNNVQRIRKEYHDTLKLNRKPQRPELWDGQAAMKCVEAIVKQHEEMISCWSVRCRTSSADIRWLIFILNLRDLREKILYSTLIAQIKAETIKNHYQRLSAKSGWENKSRTERNGQKRPVNCRNTEKNGFVLRKIYLFCGIWCSCLEAGGVGALEAFLNLMRGVYNQRSSV